MRITHILALIIACSASNTALAREDNNLETKPTVSARVIPSQMGYNRWHGIGDNISRAQLCVNSNTGRFVINLTPQLSSPVQSAPKEIEVVFTTLSGDRQVTQWDGNSPLAFTGRSQNGVCDISGNATLEFRIKQQTLMAVVAGDYLNQIRFSIDPV